MKYATLSLLVASSVFLTACGANTNNTTVDLGNLNSQQTQQKGNTMADYRGDVNELKIEDQVVGTGAEVKAGDTIEVHYTGKLLDGKVFDSSIPRGQTASFAIGVGQVIEGWDVGLIGMKEGGKRTLTIPPEMGYGARGAGASIPPNASLIFEVELISIQ